MKEPPAWHPTRVVGPAAVAATLLLLSLHQVVSGAVKQAQAQRLAPDEHERCEALADEARRDLCLLRLNAATLVADER
jgi:hypothetical protein